MSPGELKAVVDAIPVAACLLDDRRILAANEAMASLSGMAVERLLADPDPFARLLDRRERSRVDWRRVLRREGGPPSTTLDLVGLRADGAEISVRVRASPFPLAGEDVLLLLVTDSTERVRAGSLLRGFIDVAIATSREQTEADVFRVARERLRALGYHPTVLEMRGDQYRVHGPDAELGPLARELRGRSPGWRPFLGEIDLKGSEQGLFIEDLRAVLSRALERQVAEGPRSAIGASIRVASEIRFLLLCTGPDLDATQASALGLLAKQLGAGLENVVRLDELRRRNRELGALNQVARASALFGSGGALQAAIGELVGSIQVECAALFRRSGIHLHLAAHVGFEPDWLEAAREVPIDEQTPWGEAAVTEQAVLFDLDHRHGERNRTITPAEGVGEGAHEPAGAHCIALPLRAGDEINGVLVAARGVPLRNDELRLLATVAAQVAVSLQNANLLSEMQRRVEELSLLLELGQEMVGAIDLQQVLDAGARVAARALRSSSAYVFLPDEGGASLRVVAFEDPEPPAGLRAGVRADLRLGLERPSLSALAFHTRRPQASNHSHSDERVDAKIAEMLRCRSSLAVPLVSHDRSLGVLALIERTERTFTSQDVRLATHAAHLVAAALERTELYEHERRRAEEMGRLNAELARTQEELIDRERLAALGELSASIAHEVRNPLGVIFNSLGSLRRLTRAEGDVGLLLDIVGEEADRLNRMVGDLLDYSRPLQPALQPVPLRPLIEEALEAAKAQTGAAAEAVTLRVTVAHSLPPLRADSRLLRQALINLFLNALQAMPKGGELRVRADSVANGGEPSARIVIRDTGPGVPAEARQRIWQPFFTTKATGTGLGLAVVKRIIEGHRGDIVLAESDKGAEFRLRLPLEG